ncbi:MAG: DMT family transporter [Lachnospiraceae bacterium]|nr:DMT family transporter [Lachnospiraceae bacterium]
MKYVEKHPMIMIVIGVLGISLSAIFVKYSTAPSAVTAAFRLLWTVLLMTPVVVGKKQVRQEMMTLDKKNMILSGVSGIFLAIHFVFWFESLKHTSVASSTTIVCTEVIWVALGFCALMKGKLNKKAILAIAVTFTGSVIIACADSTSGGHLYGDVLALLAAVAVAVYTLIGRVVREKVSTIVYTYVVYVSCAVVLVGTCIVQGYVLFDCGVSALVVGLLLAVFSTILGHSVFSWCLKYFSPAFVSASKLCEPVVAAIFASFLFGEVPTLIFLLGGGMILGGVLFYSKIEMEK